MHLNATKWCSVPNQVVKCQCLLGKCMFSGWTNTVSLHQVASYERLHSLWQELYWWDLIFILFFFYKRNYAFWCILHASWFPMQWAEQLLCHLECERIPGQLLKVGHLSKWMGWLLRVEVGEQKADGPTKFCQSSLSIMWLEYSWVGSLSAYSAGCDPSR